MTPTGVTAVREFPDATWADDGPTRGVEALVEAGEVLRFAYLPFALLESELRFRDPRWADRKARNIALRWGGDSPGGELRGAAGKPGELAALKAMLARYADRSEAFALRLLPHYRGHLRRGDTSFRPVDAAGRATGWRHDDTRLHVEACASQPTRGARLLRVFCNVNPSGQPVEWRVGEPFEAHARRYLPGIDRGWRGSAGLLAKLRIRQSRRTEYDHLMAQLHDRAKADAGFQRDSPQARVAFAPGTTWVAFVDQVPHAVMSGQHLLEQTFHLDAADQQRPQTSPRSTLERLLGRELR